MKKIFAILENTPIIVVYGTFWTIVITLGYLSQTYENTALFLLGIFGISLIILAVKMKNNEPKMNINHTNLTKNRSSLNNDYRVENLIQEVESLEKEVTFQSMVNSRLRNEIRTSKNTTTNIVQNITITDSAIVGDVSAQINSEIDEAGIFD